MDSSNVTASGEGLVSCMVGRSTSFIVNTTRATMINGEVTMKITCELLILLLCYMICYFKVQLEKYILMH